MIAKSSIKRVKCVLIEYIIVLYDFIHRLAWLGWLVWWTPSIRRKVGIPRGILPHVQTGYWESRLAWVREGSYGQFYPNTT